MSFETWLSTDDAAYWEKTYYEHVLNSTVGVDEWILHWIWNNIKIPTSKEFSIFSPNMLTNKTLMKVKIEISCFHQGKTRYLKMCCYNENEFYPYYEITNAPDTTNFRFESVGNPLIDTVNYRLWEELLLFKLLSEILLEHGGIDALAEGIRRGL
jgi:hypothetical protein